MDNLQEEIELRMESLKRAIKEAMMLPDVIAYINILNKFEDMKMLRDAVSVEDYNAQLDFLMSDMDSMKELPNVKMFIGLFETYRSLEETQRILNPSGDTRK